MCTTTHPKPKRKENPTAKPEKKPSHLLTRVSNGTRISRRQVLESRNHWMAHMLSISRYCTASHHAPTGCQGYLRKRCPLLTNCCIRGYVCKALCEWLRLSSGWLREPLSGCNCSCSSAGTSSSSGLSEASSGSTSRQTSSFSRSPGDSVKGRHALRYLIHISPFPVLDQCTMLNLCGRPFHTRVKAADKFCYILKINYLLVYAGMQSL